LTQPVQRPGPRGGRLRESADLLRSPTSGVAGQGVRFAIAGGTVAIVYLTTTTVLSAVVGLPFQLALAVGFCLSLVCHFTLQRTFVWVRDEEFALPLGSQVWRYLAVAGMQYAVTAASTSLLPSALGLPTEAVYLATAGVLLCSNFLVFRHGIFHAAQSRTSPPLGSGKPPVGH
jgi:putative flippase GtrA